MKVAIDGTSQLAEASVVDACGLHCPEPLMLLHREIRALCDGELLRLIATDPSTHRDVVRFCHYLGHTLLSAPAPSTLGSGAELHFLIRKGSATRSERGDDKG